MYRNYKQFDLVEKRIGIGIRETVGDDDAVCFEYGVDMAGRYETTMSIDCSSAKKIGGEEPGEQDGESGDGGGVGGRLIGRA